MFFTIKLGRLKKVPAVLLLIAAVLAAAALFGSHTTVETESEARAEPCLVIDPGHGGRDGGAVSMGGDKESVINLEIGLRLKSLAELYGVKTVMTRSGDNGADNSGEAYSEHRELVARTDIINSVPNAVLISIHQNFYPTSEPSGAQVLYAGSEASKSFGNLTHGNIVTFLDPQNRRLAAPAQKTLYITSHVDCPAILVECGFMSNLTEVQKLLNKDYQTSFAAVLLASYIQFSASAESV